MDALYSVLAILIGLILRLVLPIAITIIAIYFLRKLDTHWQVEAEHELHVPANKVECWDVKHCPIEQRKECPAFTSPLACWQVNRLPNGYLHEECLTCKVFRNAPPPMAHIHA
jgi:hypothetical protein